MQQFYFSTVSPNVLSFAFGYAQEEADQMMTNDDSQVLIN